MAMVRSHGGQCCGIKHIYGMESFHTNQLTETKESLERKLQDFNRNCRVRGRLMEIVLTDKQCRRQPQLLEWMQELGFKLVQRFGNANSGSNCNVFHYHPHPKPIDDLPFDWKNSE